MTLKKEKAIEELELCSNIKDPQERRHAVNQIIYEFLDELGYTDLVDKAEEIID